MNFYLFIYFSVHPSSSHELEVSLSASGRKGHTVRKESSDCAARKNGVAWAYDTTSRYFSTSWHPHSSEDPLAARGPSSHRLIWRPGHANVPRCAAPRRVTAPFPCRDLFVHRLRKNIRHQTRDDRRCIKRRRGEGNVRVTCRSFFSPPWWLEP